MGDVCDGAGALWEHGTEGRRETLFIITFLRRRDKGRLTVGVEGLRRDQDIVLFSHKIGFRYD